MEELKENKFISKTNSGFPEYLDFNALRKEGIEYLGQLSGKLWTDHNVHDPGITILEILCYALLDLGYRTNLPAIDLFTRSPKDSFPDNNFFTPSQILTCNPVTITDFRKLLIDIEGIKNAWLEIAEDQKDFCKRDIQPTTHTHDHVDCVEFLNGLYHVYIDLEKNLQKDFKTEQERRDYSKSIYKKVKEALMAHRNLCEDFVDITILCKLELGVCAEFELEEGVDAEKIYLEVVETLRNFFSPSPRFYTLSQLLEKNKSIEEIFAGRPYDLKESHGFVDTEAFEQLELKKEIHVSDVYNVLLAIKGVKAVRRLKLANCQNPGFSGNSEWKFQIPENHVPDFSLDCSAFRFTRNSMPLQVNFKKYEGLFEINFQHNGKVLYQAPSLYLDYAIPKGIYRSDIADYYSVQNEFPRVYGITEGGLSKDAPKLRKAQALQLKGYLLFFDQLLANYLTQLKNVRSLFALYPSENEEENHTYFINNLNTVPDFKDLLRFGSDKSTVGGEGSSLLFPVNKQKLLEAIETKTIEEVEISHFPSYSFFSTSQRDLEILLIRDNLVNEIFQVEYVTQSNGCVFYYILTTSEDFVLLGANYFKSEKEAKEAFSTVKYIGTFEENFTKTNTPAADSFSFTLDFKLSSYSKFLQLIVEDKALYLQRRQGFLNHLLARFSEKFTDFALLSYDFENKEKQLTSSNKVKEKFLKNYPELSSTRGKAYDYFLDGWNNDNISGYEKRFKALLGITNWKRHSLCNFEVYKYEDTYNIEIKIEGETLLKSEKSFEYNNAIKTLKVLFEKGTDTGQFSTYYDDHFKAHSIQLKLENGQILNSPLTFPTTEQAEEGITHFKKTFSRQPDEQDVFVSKYLYRTEIRNYANQVIRLSKKSYLHEQDALKSFEALMPQVNEPSKWEILSETKSQVGTLYKNPFKEDGTALIDFNGFKTDIDDNIEGKPEKYTYELLDKKNRFKFQSAKEFDKWELAEEDSKFLIALLMDAVNYQIIKVEDSKKHLIQLVYEGQVQATTTSASNSPEQALQRRELILSIANEHQYFVTVEERPDRWKFDFKLGISKAEHFDFQSTEEFKSFEGALAGAKKFYAGLGNLELKEKNKTLKLITGEDEKAVVELKTPKTKNKEAAAIHLDALQKQVNLKHQIHQLSLHPDPKNLRDFIILDEKSRKGNYVYRVVNKDELIAYSPSKRKIKDEAAAKDLIECLTDKAIKGYTFLEICLGGDITRKRKDQVTNTFLYHYQIKSRNRYYKTGALSGKEIVLFESTTGYETPESAEKAFRENYLVILKKALNPINYGENKYILLKELYKTGYGSCSSREGVVFIPDETLTEFGGNADQSVKKIIKWVKSYPVRYIKKGSYKFVLYDIEKDGADWRSTKSYSIPQEALQTFYFFYRLLNYKGNYWINFNNDSCSYKVYLREILAESAERFLLAKDAWGKNGIQKLVNVSQTADAYHTYLKKDDCRYTFYIGCKNSFAIHPCKYNSPQKRDEALEKLWKIFNKLGKQKYFTAFTPSSDGLIRDFQGNEVARLRSERNDRTKTPCQRWIELMESILKDKNYKLLEGKGFYLFNENNEIIAEPVAKNLKLEEWKERLSEIAYYFPIIRTTDTKGNNKYCIEIKLPGINSRSEDLRVHFPCSDQTPENPDLCFVAWKSDCCFATCEEAMRKFAELIRILINYENYRPVFDCTCGSYGIELQQEKDIVAYNPQCYSTPQMTCEAVERTKYAINAEGLHLVEHILLRPHCEEDCNCRGENCQNVFDQCEFPNWKRSDNPCEKRKDICFKPGTDPYSFITTVVLPSWPERFRKEENRLVIENILQREAPAHILLRVLWLAPHDFCCFEQYFKKWSRWLAKKKFCNEQFSNCDFVKFLFDRKFECLDDTLVCETCNEEPPKIIPCLEDQREQRVENPDFFEQVNTLFCWEGVDCRGYEYFECGEFSKRDERGNRILSHRALITPSKDVATAIKPKLETAEKEMEAIVDIEEKISDPKEITKIYNWRNKNYKNTSKRINTESKENPLVKKADDFLSSKKQNADILDQLLEEIFKNKRSKEKEYKTLTKKQTEELVATLVACFLDKISFGKIEMPEEESLKALFNKLMNKKINLLNTWDREEIRKYDLKDINVIE